MWRDCPQSFSRLAFIGCLWHFCVILLSDNIIITCSVNLFIYSSSSALYVHSNNYLFQSTVALNLQPHFLYKPHLAPFTLLLPPMCLPFSFSAAPHSSNSGRFFYRLTAPCFWLALTDNRNRTDRPHGTATSPCYSSFLIPKCPTCPIVNDVYWVFDGDWQIYLLSTESSFDTTLESYCVVAGRETCYEDTEECIMFVTWLGVRWYHSLFRHLVQLTKRLMIRLKWRDVLKYHSTLITGTGPFQHAFLLKFRQKRGGQYRDLLLPQSELQWLLTIFVVLLVYKDGLCEE